MTGSGNETISHLYENGRITVMFSACRSDMLDPKHQELTWAVSTVEGPARIVRLFGKGRVFERNSTEFRELLPDGDERILPGTRAIIWIDFIKGSYRFDELCGNDADPTLSVNKLWLRSALLLVRRRASRARYLLHETTRKQQARRKYRSCPETARVLEQEELS